MITRKFPLLLPGLALLVTLSVPLSAAHAQPLSHANASIMAPATDMAFSKFSFGDKKKPKPTPGPQDGDDD